MKHLTTKGEDFVVPEDVSKEIHDAVNKYPNLPIEKVLQTITGTRFEVLHKAIFEKSSMENPDQFGQFVGIQQNDHFVLHKTDYMKSINISHDRGKQIVIRGRRFQIKKILFQTSRLIFIKMIPEILTLSKFNTEHGFSYKVFGDTNYKDAEKPAEELANNNGFEMSGKVLNSNEELINPSQHGEYFAIHSSGNQHMVFKTDNISSFENRGSQLHIKFHNGNIFPKPIKSGRLVFFKKIDNTEQE